MPYIEVKAVDRRFEDPAVAQRLIEVLTDAACEVFGEESRSSIWVVVEGVPAGRWGIGGKPLGGPAASAPANAAAAGEPAP